MWSNKKQDKPPPADPGLKNVQMNRSAKPAVTSWEGTTKTCKDVMRPTEATSERAFAARTGPVLEDQSQPEMSAAN